MGYRLVEVKELADYRLIADVFGYGAEAVSYTHLLIFRRAEDGAQTRDPQLGRLFDNTIQLFAC